MLASSLEKKRRHVREDATNAAKSTWFEYDDYSTLDATIINTSRGGMGIVTSRAMIPGMKVWHRRPGMRIALKVRYCIKLKGSGNYQVGLMCEDEWLDVPR